MILTCPECDTKYVVKDGAIPPGGRQVRCASCKHSWHEPGPDEMAQPAERDVMTPAPEADAGQFHVDAPPVDEELGGPPQSNPDLPDEPPVADLPAEEAGDQGVADYREPAVEPDQRLYEQVDTESDPVAAVPVEQSYEPAYEPLSTSEDAEDFAIPQFEEERTGRGLRTAVAVLLLVAAAVAAFWFLAPAELKSRVGMAGAGTTPLEVMLTTSDRQKLASGNELLAISGRVINPTDETQTVPPIRASLRNKATRKLVYEWTIAPPAASLPPRGSANFNSAEVDIPEGGDELTVTLGGAKS